MPGRPKKITLDQFLSSQSLDPIGELRANSFVAQDNVQAENGDPRSYGNLSFANNRAFGNLFKDGGEGNGIGANFSVDQAVALGVPLVSAFTNNKALKKLEKEGLDFKPENVSLARRTPRALKGRRFSISSRRPTGSSLLERELGLNQIDLVNEERQRQFDVQNEQFVQQQVDRNTQIQNQEALINNQTNNRAGLVNTQLKNQRAANLANQTSASLEAALQNFINMRNQSGQLDAVTKAQFFQNLVEGGATKEQIDSFLEKAYPKQYQKLIKEYASSK